jgi:hypothetical protein
MHGWSSMNSWCCAVSKTCLVLGLVWRAGLVTGVDTIAGEGLWGRKKPASNPGRRAE